MPKSNLIPFAFEQSQVRVVKVAEEVWFVAKDVLIALDYSESAIESTTTTIKHIPEQWRDLYRIQVSNRWQKVWLLSEQGLYFFHRGI